MRVIQIVVVAVYFAVLAWIGFENLSKVRLLSNATLGLLSGHERKPLDLTLLALIGGVIAQWTTARQVRPAEQAGFYLLIVAGLLFADQILLRTFAP